MAKLSQIADSDEEFPELSIILAERALLVHKPVAPPSSSNRRNPPKQRDSSTAEGKSTINSLLNGKGQTENQRPHKAACVNSILLSPANQGALSPESKPRTTTFQRKCVRSPPKHVQSASAWLNPKDPKYVSSDHISDFVVRGSDSEDSITSDKGPTPRCFPSLSTHQSRQIDVYTPSKAFHDGPGNSLCSKSPRNSSQDARHGEIDPIRSPAQRRQNINIFRRDVGAADRNNDGSEEPNTILRFSPPRLKSPSRSTPGNLVTPPTSPTKSKLLSPSKRFHIPPSPYRPSIDAFWSQEVINDWNDQYSPKKTPKSSHTRKLRSLEEDDEAYLSPCQTGVRSPSKSPVKADKQAAERQKAFNEKKYDLGASFLKELDHTIVNGQIADLTESTGGVRLVWSKKLQSTAGRANWKREAFRTKEGEGKVTTTRYRHHASIELAEKVIDDEDRLMNVIAHEYCHLLNFMISNIKDKPHGKEFKIWAKKCSTAFAHRGVNVITTHAYEISYKYIWACSKCGTEYKRHSKSIDPARHSCGKCHGKLVQTKPVPRGEGKGMSEYQKFVKENLARVKRESPEMSMGEVMAALGKEFRGAREKRKGEMTPLEGKAMEDDGLCGNEDAGFDSVVRKLDFLNIGTA
ncbi:MAG: hypothetical protein Q9166_002913 [cf. Caloplaca sp. 2 TL-2023]